MKQIFFLYKKSNTSNSMEQNYFLVEISFFLLISLTFKKKTIAFLYANCLIKNKS
jgi:hypothetical protein